MNKTVYTPPPIPRLRVGQLWQSDCGNTWIVEGLGDTQNYPNSPYFPCWAWVRRIEPKQDTHRYCWHWLAFQTMKLTYEPK